MGRWRRWRGLVAERKCATRGSRADEGVRPTLVPYRFATSNCTGRAIEPTAGS